MVCALDLPRGDARPQTGAADVWADADMAQSGRVVPALLPNCVWSPQPVRASRASECPPRSAARWGGRRGQRTASAERCRCDVEVFTGGEEPETRDREPKRKGGTEVEDRTQKNLLCDM